MSFKFVVFGACLALVASATIKSGPSQVDLRGPNDVPISKAKSDQLLQIHIAPFETPKFVQPPDVFVRRLIPRHEFILIRNANQNRRYTVVDDQTESLRAKRQVKVPDSASLFKRIDIQPPPRPNIFQNKLIDIQGGGTSAKGNDFRVDVRPTLWQSNNQRNSLQGSFQYQQHAGVPLDRNLGFIFNHRFGK